MTVKTHSGTVIEARRRLRNGFRRAAAAGVFAASVLATPAFAQDVTAEKCTTEGFLADPAPFATLIVLPKSVDEKTCKNVSEENTRQQKPLDTHCLTFKWFKNNNKKSIGYWYRGFNVDNGYPQRMNFHKKRSLLFSIFRPEYFKTEQPMTPEKNKDFQKFLFGSVEDAAEFLNIDTSVVKVDADRVCKEKGNPETCGKRVFEFRDRARTQEASYLKQICALIDDKEDLMEINTKQSKTLTETEVNLETMKKEMRPFNAKIEKLEKIRWIFGGIALMFLIMMEVVLFFWYRSDQRLEIAAKVYREQSEEAAADLNTELQRYQRNEIATYGLFMALLAFLDNRIFRGLFGKEQQTSETDGRMARTALGCLGETMESLTANNGYFKGGRENFEALRAAVSERIQNVGLCAGSAVYEHRGDFDQGAPADGTGMEPVVPVTSGHVPSRNEAVEASAEDDPGLAAVRQSFAALDQRLAPLAVLDERFDRLEETLGRNLSQHEAAFSSWGSKLLENLDGNLKETLRTLEETQKAAQLWRRYTETSPIYRLSVSTQVGTSKIEASPGTSLVLQAQARRDLAKAAYNDLAGRRDAGSKFVKCVLDVCRLPETVLEWDHRDNVFEPLASAVISNDRQQFLAIYKRGSVNRKMTIIVWLKTRYFLDHMLCPLHQGDTAHPVFAIRDAMAGLTDDIRAAARSLGIAIHDVSPGQEIGGADEFVKHSETLGTVCKALLREEDDDIRKLFDDWLHHRIKGGIDQTQRDRLVEPLSFGYSLAQAGENGEPTEVTTLGTLALFTR